MLPEETIMQSIRIAIVSFIIAGALAACSGAAAVPATHLPVTSAPPVASIATSTPTPVAGTSAAATPIAIAVDPTISLYEWKVVAPATLKAGKTSFKISNFGTLPHELLIFKSPLAADKYPTDASGNIKEEGGGVDLLSDGENI